MKNHTSRLLNLTHKIRYRLILEGALIGGVSGLLVSLYRYVLFHAESFSQAVYRLVQGHWGSIAIVFAVLIVFGILCGLLVKSEPMIKGSGIPQVEGMLLGRFHPCWYRVIIKKFICGVVAIGSGLSLGREGPSIQLGASIGQAVSKWFHRIRFEEKYLITCGASAGLAAAFNAPLAGVLFALEEVHKTFSPSILLSAMAASITGDFVSKSIFGMEAVFNTAPAAPLPLKFYLIVVIMGILLGIGGGLYNKTLLKTQDLYAKLSIPDWIKPVIPFVFAGVFGLTLPAVLGGGHNIIEGIIANSFTIQYMLLLLAVKFIFSMVSFGSGTAGGIFFPLLVLGALIGAVTGQISVRYFALPEVYVVTFMLLGMVGIFTSIVRAPVTGIILIVEMSGSLSHLLTLTIVTILAYITAESMRAKPIYESLLERMSGPECGQEQTEQLVAEFTVGHASRIDDKRIKDLPLPKGCLIVGVGRQGREITPTGSTVIKGGDVLTVIYRSDLEEKIRAELELLMDRV